MFLSVYKTLFIKIISKCYICLLGSYLLRVTMHFVSSISGDLSSPSFRLKLGVGHSVVVSPLSRCSPSLVMLFPYSICALAYPQFKFMHRSDVFNVPNLLFIY